jgi:ankyrin repeat protein
MTTTSLTAEFISAAARGDLDSVRRMLDADPSLAQAREPTGERAIHAAYYSGNFDVCDYLWAHGVERDIFLLCELGRIEEVSALLAADSALARATRSGGATPLHTAARWGYPGIMRLLLALGADPNANTTPGFRPLHSALAAPPSYAPGAREETNVEVADVLLDAGADVNARNAAGLTPLFNAAAHGEVRVLRRLIERGADPTVAAYADAEPERGPNGEVLFEFAGKTALDLAADRGRDEAAAFLRQYAGVS